MSDTCMCVYQFLYRLMLKYLVWEHDFLSLLRNTKVVTAKFAPSEIV